MCCQVSIHDVNGKNPHADFMMTMRKWDDKKGTWAAKQKKVYEHDSEGHLIPDGRYKNGKIKYKSQVINNAWDDKTNVQKWRDLWEKKTNEALLRAGKPERVSLKSLKKRRDEALKKGNLEEAERLNREPSEHYGPRNGKGKSAPAQRRNAESRTAQKPKKTRDEVIAAKKREAFWAKQQKAKSQQIQRERFAARYGIEPNPREIGYMKRCLREGADIKVGELPKTWNELEPKEHLQISESMRKCGLKSQEARKMAKKECVFMYDRLHHEWAFTKDEAIKQQVNAVKGAINGGAKIAGKGGKMAIAVIGAVLKLPGKIPGINRIPGIGLPGQLAQIAKTAKSAKATDLAKVTPKEKPPQKGGVIDSLKDSKEKFDTIKNAKDGVKPSNAEGQSAPPKKDSGIKEVLKEALGEVKGGFDANLKAKDGAEYSSVWLSEAAKEQWKIDHGMSIEDEWEVQGFSKGRRINPNATFRAYS